MTFWTHPATDHVWHPAAASLPQARWHTQTHDLPPHPKQCGSRAGHASGQATQDKKIKTSHRRGLLRGRHDLSFCSESSVIAGPAPGRAQPVVLRTELRPRLPSSSYGSVLVHRPVIVALGIGCQNSPPWLSTMKLVVRICPVDGSMNSVACSPPSRVNRPRYSSTHRPGRSARPTSL